MCEFMTVRQMCKLLHKDAEIRGQALDNAVITNDMVAQKGRFVSPRSHQLSSARISEYDNRRLPATV